MLHEGQGRDYERLHISSSDDDWTAMPLKGKLSPSMGSVPVLLSPYHNFITNYFASFLVFLYLFLDCEHNEAKNQVYFIQHHLVQRRNPIFAESIIE